MSMGSLLLVIHQSSLRVVTEEEALATLSDDERAMRRRVESLDMRPLSEDLENGYWPSSHVFLREAAARLREAADACGATEIRYLGIAEVPHVLALGAYLGDERLVRVRDYDRDANTWAWPATQGTLEVEISGKAREVVSQPGDAVIRVEISYPVKDGDVEDVLGPERLADIRIAPRSRAPAPGLVRCEEDVARVRQAVREAHTALVRARPNLEVIHLFVAAPVSVCLAIGQELRLRNGPDVQTYRYRSASAGPAQTPAIRLTSRDVTESPRALSSEERALARHLRQAWQRGLEDVKTHAKLLEATAATDAARWFDALEPREALQAAAPFPGLRPIWQLVDARDAVADTAVADEFRLDKDSRAWHLSDALVLSMFEAAGRDEARLQAHARLFFWHEYLHDFQGLTAYTSEDVGRLANCLERVDYMADTYAICHHVDFLRRAAGNGPQQQFGAAVVAQIDLALRSFWAFEPPPPLRVMQERRLRRYLNWYWRRVQIRDAESSTVFGLLGNLPCVEVSGLQHRLGGERNFVVLDARSRAGRLHVGLVLEDGRLERYGSSTDLNLEELLRAFLQHDHAAITRFFNALWEHVR